MGAADFGLVAAFDAQGTQLWRQVLVSHIGSICVDGLGQSVWLACYTDGLRRLNAATGQQQPMGKSSARADAAVSCRLACCDYDGKLIVTAEESTGRTLNPSSAPSGSLSLLKPDGTVLGSYALLRPSAHLVVDALGRHGACAPAEGPISLFTLAS
jgi:hypothetical protein